MLIPLLLLAAAAVAATAKPTTPAGGGQPPAPPKCELDAQIPPALASQVLSYLEQASALVAQNANPTQKQALASALDQVASSLSMGGFPKAANCLSTASAMLRAGMTGPAVPGVPPCELDAGIPPEVAAQVSAYLAKAYGQMKPEEKPAFAAMLMQGASGLEMAGYPKAAKCVRDAAKALQTSQSLSSCQLDPALPPEMASQVLSYLEQAKQALPSSQKAALATAMEMAATPLEMSGFPKAAKCLRDAAQMLRIQSESSASSLQRSNEAPLMLGGGTSMQASSSTTSGMTINVTPRPKDA